MYFTAIVFLFFCSQQGKIESWLWNLPIELWHSNRHINYKTVPIQHARCVPIPWVTLLFSFFPNRLLAYITEEIKTISNDGVFGNPIPLSLIGFSLSAVSIGCVRIAEIVPAERNFRSSVGFVQFSVTHDPSLVMPFWCWLMLGVREPVLRGTLWLLRSLASTGFRLKLVLFAAVWCDRFYSRACVCTPPTLEATVS